MLDPCFDKPEKHLAFDDDGFVMPRSERGSLTIDVFRLNRDALIAARAAAIAEALASARTALASREPLTQLAPLVDVIRPYAGAVRPAVRRLLEREGIARQLGPELGLAASRPTRIVTPAVSPEVQPVKLVGLSLRNVRAVEELALEFPAGVGGWNMLLGENGSGKTTVLRSIALGLMGDAARGRLHLNADEWIRAGADVAEITLHVEGVREPRRLTIRRGSNRFVAHGPDFPAAMAAYGAGRLPPHRDSGTLPRRLRVGPESRTCSTPTPLAAGRLDRSHRVRARRGPAACRQVPRAPRSADAR